ncbi:hypothetical protein [Massilia sp. S19_KUP03_FR1]|uniref:hypothetical protein n=1 Tax=Massilia sp. S19_KUP03_FR1 TaxID=3025503 RepID=UPI002FCD32D9
MIDLIFDAPAADAGVVFDAQTPAVPMPVIVPISDPEYEAWLSSPDAIPVTLFESDVLVDGAEVTRYTCNGSFPITGPLDSPANTFYDPIASAGVQFTEQVSLTSAATMAVGDVEFDNGDFVRDDWYLDDIWASRGQRAYFGDARWAASNFRMILNGMASGIARKSRFLLAVKLRDQLQRLDTPISDRTFGGTSLMAGTLYPSCFGECFNITPVYDPGTDRYYVHFGPVEWIFEVRMNGMVIDESLYTVNHAEGYFTLAVDDFGTVTCSVQGDKFGGVYRNTVAALVRRIATGYGKEDGRYIDADLDLANLDAFEASHPQKAGIYITDNTTVKNAIDQLASSLGAQAIPSRLGKLRLIQIGIAGASTFDIRVHHMKNGTLEPVTSIPPVAAASIGYDRNWTKQDNLVTAISDANKQLFVDDYLYATTTNDDVADDYKMSTAVTAKPTLLKIKAEAQAEADRLVDLGAVPRSIYKFTGTPEMLQIVLGQQVTIYHHENSMAAGVRAQVIMLAPEWKQGSCDVGVLV